MMKTRLCPVGRGSLSIFYLGWLAGEEGEGGARQRGEDRRLSYRVVSGRAADQALGRGGPGDRGMRGFRRLAPLCSVQLFHFVTNEVSIRFQ